MEKTCQTDMESKKEFHQTDYIFRPIGFIRSCFKEKFGIPRQPGLLEAATGQLVLLPPYNSKEAVRALEEFSHVWIVFVFHALAPPKQKTTVRPPRLGGNRRLGVFATRSGFRPNPIGLSVVKLERISHGNAGCTLHLKGLDLLDGTPVLDVKPYLPYTDCLTTAAGGFAQEAPCDRNPLPVEFDSPALEYCLAREAADLPGLRAFITAMLTSDPRPAYYKKTSRRKRFGVKVFDLEVKWEVADEQIRVTEVYRV